MKRFKRWIGWIVAAVIVATGIGVWAYKRSHRPPEVQFKTAPVERRNILARVTASGTLQARVTVQVGSQVSGRVAQLFADFNTTVKKDMVIAKLDPQLYQAAIAQARANFNSAQSNVAKAVAQKADADRQYERAKAQRTEGLISQQELDSAQTTAAVAKAQVDASKSAVQQAKAALDQDEVNLSYTVIKSPIDGVVISRNVDVGQTVAASLQAPVLFTIGEDLTKMRVEASVPESDVGRLKEGMSASFTVDAFPGQKFRGTVAQVRNAATTVQNVVTYTAVIDVDNADLRLRPGMTANVTIVTAEKRGVLAIPNSALRFRPAGAGTAGPRGSGSAGARAGGFDGPPGAASGGWRQGGRGARAPGASSAAPGNSAGPTEVAVTEAETKTVYVLNGTAPAAVRIQAGITDGSYTELIGDALHEGDGVIVEGPAAAGAAAGSSSPLGGARGGRLF
jgi:HlyD family secretion protein